MKKNKKVPLSKKPFLVLSRRAIAGWLGVIFILCAWMFVIGVLVGRGTAPIKFDIDDLQRKLAISRQDEKNGQGGSSRSESDIVKDKTKLDFYEALPEDREDTRIDAQKSGGAISKKVEPSPEKKKPTTTKKSTPKKKTAVKTAPAKKEPAKLAPQKSTASKSEVTPSQKTYTVQVAAVKVAKDADRLVAQLKKKGFPAYRTITKVEGKGIWFRVRIGKYQTKTAARATKQKLAKAGMKPILVLVEK